MISIFIGAYSPWSSGTVCLECRRPVLGPCRDQAASMSAAAVLCPECGGVTFDGLETVVDGDRLAVHPLLIPGHRVAQGAAVPGGSLSSPRWVQCPNCGAVRGDRCQWNGIEKKEGWCASRIEANSQRLAELDTWAVRRESPCCKTPVFLVWRSAENDITWTGVPCFACHKTYTYGAHADELVPERQPVDRLYPEKLEVVCWATEEADPWGSANKNT